MLEFVLKCFQFVLGNYTFTMRNGPAKGMRRRYGLGFKPGMRATDDERYLTSLNFVGKTVYDIGGYVGIYTLFFAHAAGPDGHVVAFEPNPQNYRELQLNVQLNKFTNVTAIQSAIGAHCGNIALHVDPLAPARGFIAGARDDLPLKKRARVPVELWSLDNMIAQRGLTPPDFVKIDVEGAELDVLNGMLRTLDTYRPDLFIELHYAIPALIPLLIQKNYCVYHIEGQAWMTPDSPPISWGHVLCSKEQGTGKK